MDIEVDKKMNKERLELRKGFENPIPWMIPSFSGSLPKVEYDKAKAPDNAYPSYIPFTMRPKYTECTFPYLPLPQNIKEDLMEIIESNIEQYGKLNLFDETCPTCGEADLVHIRLEHLLSKHTTNHISIDLFTSKLNKRKQKKYSYLCCVCTECKIPYVLELPNKFRTRLPRKIYDGYEIKKAMDEADNVAPPF
jgi:hypothetical protein|tara:strand:+ start:4814 stop:5395 length:582 start_codon:yes stop_codon:yes gene_type:complete